MTANRNTPLHNSWCNMKARCNNPNRSTWKNYGGRGITYCQEWELFVNFVKDMGASWQPGLELDRKDNNGPYNKDNCRWATHAENNQNKRPVKITKEQEQAIKQLYLTRKYTQATLAKMYGITQAGISAVLRRVW